MEPRSLLQVVAEPRREKILLLVWDRERSAGEIAGHFDVTFAAVSQHLKVLLDAGALEVRKEGRHRYYRARKAALGPVRAMLEAMWAEKLLDLKRLAEAEEEEEEGGRPERE